jgi:hypothetical protein
MYSPLVRVASYSPKGQGCIATIKISKGTLIHTEAFLFRIPKHKQPLPALNDLITMTLQSLPPDQAATFHSLHNQYAPSVLQPLDGLLKTNGVPEDASYPNSDILIFPASARFNHSCAPNAYSSLNKSSNSVVRNIYATHDIAQGEEITLSYISYQTWALHRLKRQTSIKKNFNFDCLCHICNLTATEIAASDERRQLIALNRRLLHDITKLSPTAHHANYSIRSFRQVLSYLKLEQASEVLMAALVYEPAFLVHTAHGDVARASSFNDLICKAEGIGGQGGFIVLSLMNMSVRIRRRSGIRD